MELGVRDWMILIGVLLILAVLLDGYRRMRDPNRIRVSLAPVPEGDEDDVAVNRELPNGGARVKYRGDGEPEHPEDPAADAVVGRGSPAKPGFIEPGQAPTEAHHKSEAAGVAAQAAEHDPDAASAPELADGTGEPPLLTDTVAPKSRFGRSPEPPTEALEPLPEAEPETAPVSEPVSEPVPEPVPQPTPQTSRQPTPQPVPQRQPEPAPVSESREETDADPLFAEPEPRPARRGSRFGWGRSSGRGPGVEPAPGENLDLLDGISAVEPDDEPHLGPVEPEEAPPPEEVLMLHVVSRDESGFPGEDILQVLLAYNLRFGDMNFFHRHEESAGRGPIQFSVANMLKPGVFNIDAMADFSTTGLIFFLTLPGPRDMMAAFEMMLETAQGVAEHLGGDVLDETRSATTRQTLEHMRQRIRELERKLLAKGPR